MPLTPARVLNVKPQPSPMKLADGGGLYLLVQPNGSKLWRMNYRHGGRQRTLAIGSFPAVSLGKARAARESAKGLLAGGLDPSQQKKIERAQQSLATATTFRLIGEEWRAKRLQEGWSEATIAKDREMLELHAYPAFGERPVVEIKATEVLAVIRRMEARGHRAVSHRFKSVVSRVFRYAVITDRADRDPAAALTGALLPQTAEPAAALTDPVVVGHLMNAIAGYHGQATVRLGMQFLAHTFVRTIEMRSAQWSWIDWERRLITVPAGVMKMKRPHIVPLSEAVVEILRQAQALDLPGDLIFRGGGPSHARMSDNTINAALSRLGYGGDIHTGHGFRRTASTVMHESGRFQSDWIERQLAHVDGNKVRGIYNAAEYLDARRGMMDWYSDWLSRQAAVASLM